MYGHENHFNVTGNLIIVIECNIGTFFKKKWWGTSKNYQITNGVKWDKMELRWKTSMFRLFSWEIWHNCCFLTLRFNCWFFLGVWAGRGGTCKFAKLVNGYCYCQKRPKTAWISNILGGRFENLVKGKTQLLAWGRGSNFRPLLHEETWEIPSAMKKTGQNIDKTS